MKVIKMFQLLMVFMGGTVFAANYLCLYGDATSSYNCHSAKLVFSVLLAVFFGLSALERK